jgi:hypothetical protein
MATNSQLIKCLDYHEFQDLMCVQCEETFQLKSQLSIHIKSVHETHLQPLSEHSLSLIHLFWRKILLVLYSREHEVLARLLYPLCCCCCSSSCCCCCCWIVTHVQKKDTRWCYCFTQNFVVFLDMVSY